MKASILLVLSLFATASFANCGKRVESVFKGQNPRMSVVSVKHKGSLRARSEIPYLQGEIWNSSDRALDVYEIEAAFMARFVYVALVDERNCSVKNIIEVLFE